MELMQDIYMVGSAEFGISNNYDCHVYLIDGGSEAALIDCGVGYDTKLILQNIKKHIDLNKLKKIYLTHLHADHCGGSEDFKKFGLEIVAPKKEWLDMVENPKDVMEAYDIAKNSGCYPKDKAFILPVPDQYVEDGEKIVIGKYTLTSIELRGHSVASMAYMLEYENTRVLFSGDYVFANGLIGLLNCPGCDMSLYRKDIKKLEDLKIDTLLPGHRMVVMKQAQNHIDKAISNLSKAFIPPSF